VQQTKFSIQNGRQWDVFLLYISTATVNLMICLVATVMQSVLRHTCRTADRARRATAGGASANGFTAKLQSLDNCCPDSMDVILCFCSLRSFS